MNQEKNDKPALFKSESKFVLTTTDADFDEDVFESPSPVLVLFGAERCAQCKEMFPDVEQIASDRKSSLKACWVEVDKYKSLSQRFRIKGIPNLLLFKDGAMESRLSGLQPLDEIEEWLDDTL